jgi:hypothetical protein
MDPDKSIADVVTPSRNSGKHAPNETWRGSNRRHDDDLHTHLETADDSGSRGRSAKLRDHGGSSEPRRPRVGILF